MLIVRAEDPTLIKTDRQHSRPLPSSMLGWWAKAEQDHNCPGELYGTVYTSAHYLQKYLVQVSRHRPNTHKTRNTRAMFVVVVDDGS